MRMRLSEAEARARTIQRTKDRVRIDDAWVKIKKGEADRRWEKNNPGRAEFDRIERELEREQEQEQVPQTPIEALEQIMEDLKG